MTTRVFLVRHRPPRFDRILATLFFAGCEVEVAVDALAHRFQGVPSPVIPALAVAGMTLPVLWRRYVPIGVTTISMASTVMLALISNADLKALNTAQLVLFIVPFGAAAYASRRRALLGLVICLTAVCVVNLHGQGAGSSWVFTIGATGGSWIAGRLVQARRHVTAELRRTIGRIAAEREGRELLAIAEQRTLIARDLQTLVAHSVSAMIVQTQAAQRLLDHSVDQADAAMATIEDTGREALAEMRRILGVLRHHDEVADLAPQPGVGQIAALVERARQTQPDLTLHVEGSPGPLPASVDLGVYRILEDALSDVDERMTAVEVVLRFGPDAVELEITSPRSACLKWPTVTMRERVALCRGDIDVDPVSETGERLRVRLPRIFEAALA